jgi:GT2 family glycosyltransferase
MPTSPSTPEETVDCAVIIVTYNSAARIGQLLDSLPAAAGRLRLQCLVVDNGSQDGTVAIVRSRPEVVLVQTGRNLGYAGAINVGRSHCRRCSSVLVLNPDLALERDAIVHLHEALKDQTVGVAVPMLRNEDGTIYHSLRRDPTPARAFGDALFGQRFSRRPGWLTETVFSDPFYERSRDVAWAGGAALLVSAECDSRVGGWDSERFFLYSEETDFFTRVQRLGYRVRYVPAAVAHHEGGGSGASRSLAALLAVNRLRHYEKYHGRPRSSVFRIAVALNYLLRVRSPAARESLKAVCRRSRWTDLPCAER